MENLEKFKSLASNDAFLEKLISAKDDEEIKACFKEQGVEISDKELETFKEEFKKRASSETGKLSDEGLEEIVGGLSVRKGTSDGAFAGSITGASFGALAGVVIGSIHAAEHDTTTATRTHKWYNCDTHKLEDIQDTYETHRPSYAGAKIFFKDFLKYTAAGAIAGTGIGAGIGAASGKVSEWKNQK